MIFVLDILLNNLIIEITTEHQHAVTFPMHYNFRLIRKPVV